MALAGAQASMYREQLRLRQEVAVAENVRMAQMPDGGAAADAGPRPMRPTKSRLEVPEYNTNVESKYGAAIPPRGQQPLMIRSASAHALHSLAQSPSQTMAEHSSHVSYPRQGSAKEDPMRQGKPRARRDSLRQTDRSVGQLPARSASNNAYRRKLIDLQRGDSVAGTMVPSSAASHVAGPPMSGPMGLGANRNRIPMYASAQYHTNMHPRAMPRRSQSTSSISMCASPTAMHYPGSVPLAAQGARALPPHGGCNTQRGQFAESQSPMRSSGSPGEPRPAEQPSEPIVSQDISGRAFAQPHLAAVSSEKNVAAPSGQAVAATDSVSAPENMTRTDSEMSSAPSVDRHSQISSSSHTSYSVITVEETEPVPPESLKPVQSMGHSSTSSMGSADETATLAATASVKEHTFDPIDAAVLKPSDFRKRVSSISSASSPARSEKDPLRSPPPTISRTSSSIHETAENSMRGKLRRALSFGSLSRSSSSSSFNSGAISEGGKKSHERPGTPALSAFNSDSSRAVGQGARNNIEDRCDNKVSLKAAAKFDEISVSSNASVIKHPVNTVDKKADASKPRRSFSAIFRRRSTEGYNVSTIGLDLPPTPPESDIPGANENFGKPIVEDCENDGIESERYRSFDHDVSDGSDIENDEFNSIRESVPESIAADKYSEGESEGLRSSLRIIDPWTSDANPEELFSSESKSIPNHLSPEEMALVSGAETLEGASVRRSISLRSKRNSTESTRTGVNAETDTDGHGGVGFPQLNPTSDEIDMSIRAKDTQLQAQRSQNSATDTSHSEEGIRRDQCPGRPSLNAVSSSASISTSNSHDNLPQPRILGMISRPTAAPMPKGILKRRPSKDLDSYSHDGYGGSQSVEYFDCETYNGGADIGMSRNSDAANKQNVNSKKSANGPSSTSASARKSLAERADRIMRASASSKEPGDTFDLDLPGLTLTAEFEELTNTLESIGAGIDGSQEACTSTTRPSHTYSEVQKSSASFPRRNCSFARHISICDTWTPYEYDRRGEQATCNRLTPLLAQRIKEELNTFKMHEMAVHEHSRKFTQLFT